MHYRDMCLLHFELLHIASVSGSIALGLHSQNYLIYYYTRMMGGAYET